MMRFQAWCPAVRLSPMLLVVACSSAPCVGPATQDLGQRLQIELAPDISTGRATLQQLPDGARVTLVDRSLFAGDGSQLTNGGYVVLTRVIQGLLDPRILQITMAESPTPQPAMQGVQTGAMTQYFQAYGIATVTQPAPVGAGPQGPSITVNILPRS